MRKSDRLSRIIQVYLAGELELDTAVAEVTHVYVERGWRFALVEAHCKPQYRERMRVLAARIEAEVLLT
jgi:predicted RNA-binding protein